VFTGIAEELGEVVELRRSPSVVLVIRGPVVAADARDGDSISVNGVCLTVIENDGVTFAADVMEESLRRSNLGDLRPGDPVNLERSVQVGGRLGGHIVQGHVDGVGVVAERTPGAAWETVRVDVPPALARYIAEKGSIAVDGVSLTVVAAGGQDFSVGLIPTTLERTTLGRKDVGARVNLEVDVLAKYVERLLTAGAGAE
jgi:riboflavin synthase